MRSYLLCLLSEEHIDGLPDKKYENYWLYNYAMRINYTAAYLQFEVIPDKITEFQITIGCVAK